MRRFGPSGGKAPYAFGASGVVTAAGSALIRYGDNVALVTATLAPAGSPQIYIRSPFAGTIRNLTFDSSATPGAGVSVACTVRVNDANTAVTCTIVDPGTSASDLANTAPVAQLDRMSIGLTRAVGVPANVIYTVTFEVDPS